MQEYNPDNALLSLLLMFVAIVTLVLYFLIPRAISEIKEYRINRAKSIEDKIQEELTIYTTLMKRLGYDEKFIEDELNQAEWLKGTINRNLRMLRQENKSLRKLLRNGTTEG